MRFVGKCLAIAVLAASTMVVGAVPSQGVVANGRIVYDKSNHIWMMHDDGSAKTDLTPGWTGTASDPSLSKDGTKVVFVWQPGASPAGEEIYSIPATPTTQARGTRLTTNTVQDWFPKWSPDGTKIAFTRNVPVALQPQNYEIYSMSANGTSPLRLTNDANGDVDLSPTWSPDGSHIAFASTRVHAGCDDGNGLFIGFSHIYVMTSTGGSQADVTNRGGLTAGNPAWSPDGTQIAFDGDQWTLGPNVGNGPTCAGSTGDHIYVMAAAGSTNPGPVHTGDDPAWSPDSAKLAYIDGVGQAMSTMDANGTNVTSLIENGRFPDWGSAASGTVPSAPVIGLASSGAIGGSVTATARWTPGPNGGAPITSFTVQAVRVSSTGAVLSRRNFVRSAAARSATLSLASGRYKFRVSAANVHGSGAWSRYSNIVTAR